MSPIQSPYRLSEFPLTEPVGHTEKLPEKKQNLFQNVYTGYCFHNFFNHFHFFFYVCLFSGLGFFIFESIKEFVLSSRGILTRVNSDTGETVVTATGAVLCGAVAGLISQTVA